MSANLEPQILALGEELWKRVQGQSPGIFDKGYWQGRILDWAMRDPSFKLDMFRFVDVLPMLVETEQVSRHVREYLLKPGRELPTVVGAALKTAAGGMTAGLAVRARKNVADMAERFIVGTNAREALPVLRNLYKEGLAFTVDLLGETVLSDNEADAYEARYLDLIDNLSTEVARWPADELIDNNHLGAIPRTNVSVKVSAMEPHLDSVDPAGSVARLMKRVLPLFLRARERNVFLNLDLEQWGFHHITYDLFEALILHPQLKDWPHVGIVVQAYLKSAEDDLRRMVGLAKQRGAPITIRLVKGAYWDYEVVHAAQYGYRCPVFADKAQTDANYERLSELMIANCDHLLPAFGSHNLRSLTHAIVCARDASLTPNSYEIQMLYGMAEPERAALREMGHRVRLYAPVGEMLPGMAYLVRRLLENTANSGFLRLSHHEGADIHELLRAPSRSSVQPSPPTPLPEGEGGRDNRLPSPSGRGVGGEGSTDGRDGIIKRFANCPHTDFTDREQRRAFAQAVVRVRASLPLTIPVMIDGQVRKCERTLNRECPSNPDLIVAVVSLASEQDADDAVRSAYAAYPAWRDRPLEERAELLEKLAECLQDNRVEMAALQAFEVGKPWREADADVAEAIDFCRYYARQALVELAPRKLGNMLGEDNTLWYEGRGVAAIVAPWNFPLAILCGMATAALVAGNTIVLKPAGQSSAIAFGLYERMMKAGFDPRVVQFVPGSGSQIGGMLVDHPLVAQIAFTGSKEVGLSIIERAAKVHPGQAQVKRVVCEMGGKNAIIVDDDADLDEAVAGVMKSAFGYAGQKCSACSRVVTVGSAHEPFVARLVEACRSIHMAPGDDPSCMLPPVIDRNACEKLRGIIANPDAGATSIYVGEMPKDVIPGAATGVIPNAVRNLNASPGADSNGEIPRFARDDMRANGYFIAPALFEVTDPNHRFMQEEFFGPIVTIMKADSFARALEVANQCEFKLTGAVYSRSPANLELAKQKFRVGNLYLNRGSTGALVVFQPFGGFGMSGIGTKAGGPNYLINFADPRSVSENTMRRGMAPELEE